MSGTKPAGTVEVPERSKQRSVFPVSSVGVSEKFIKEPRINPPALPWNWMPLAATEPFRVPKLPLKDVLNPGAIRKVPVSLLS